MSAGTAEPGARARAGSTRRWSARAVGLVLLPLLAACGGGSPPTPTAQVIVVTATPAPATEAPRATSTPAASTPAATKPAATKPAADAKSTSAPASASPTARPVARAAASPTAAPAEQRLAVGRTNSYRGLEFTVEEARSGETIQGERAGRGKTLVGLHLRVQNPSGQRVHFAGGPLHELLRLHQPDGANPKAEAEDPFVRPVFEPQEAIAGWAYWELDRAVSLEVLKLLLGGSNETQAAIPLTGPEEVVAPRSFEYLRSTDEVRGLLWSVSGGTIRLDVPGQQANPGQEFIVLKVRATNPAPAELRLRGRGSIPQKGTEYLRMEADNGVLLQPSAELNALPVEFPPKAEQDALYAWQLPRGSRNPSLVILSPDGSQARLEIGPLPPP